jgi:hypothetical protein
VYLYPSVLLTERGGQGKNSRGGGKINPEVVPFFFLVRSDVKQGKKNIIFGSGDDFSLVRPKQANTR